MVLIVDDMYGTSSEKNTWATAVEEEIATREKQLVAEAKELT